MKTNMTNVLNQLATSWVHTDTDAIRKDVARMNTEIKSIAGITIGQPQIVAVSAKRLCVIPEGIVTYSAATSGRGRTKTRHWYFVPNESPEIITGFGAPRVMNSAVCNGFKIEVTPEAAKALLDIRAAGRAAWMKDHFCAAEIDGQKIILVRDDRNNSLSSRK